MKNYFLITMVLLVCIVGYAQNESKEKLLFVRVFDLNGEKIGKGKVQTVTDSTLHLKTSNGFIIFPISTIKTIKTKRSAGNNIATGATIGFAFGAILGATTADPDAWFGYTAAEGATGIGIAGAILGSTIGSLTVAFKNSNTYIINGNSELWKLINNQLVTK
jgi:hypothetical protein